MIGIAVPHSLIPDLSRFLPILSAAISLMRNFCSLPVTVIGNSVTNQTYLGTLKWAIFPLQKSRISSSVATSPARSWIHATRTDHTCRLAPNDYLSGAGGCGGGGYSAGGGDSPPLGAGGAGAVKFP